MRLIPLTRDYEAMVDDEDYDILMQWKWYAEVGKHTVYAARSSRINGKWKVVKMHRQILGLTNPKILGEHSDGNGLNNQRENIRPATHSQNMMNRIGPSGCASKFKGVAWSVWANKWLAHITADKKTIHIGYFSNEEDSARAYNQFAKELHGEFAVLNQVDPMFPNKEWKPNVVRSNNTSGFRGVSFDKVRRKWVSQIKSNKKIIHLGLFSNPEDAAKTYDKAAIEIRGDKAITNFNYQK